MPSLGIVIDASGAEEGAKRVVAATKDISQGASGAASSTKALEQEIKRALETSDDIVASLKKHASSYTEVSSAAQQYIEALRLQSAAMAVSNADRDATIAITRAELLAAQEGLELSASQRRAILDEIQAREILAAQRKQESQALEDAARANQRAVAEEAAGRARLSAELREAITAREAERAAAARTSNVATIREEEEARSRVLARLREAITVRERERQTQRAAYDTVEKQISAMREERQLLSLDASAREVVIAKRRAEEVLIKAGIDDRKRLLDQVEREVRLNQQARSSGGGGSGLLSGVGSLASTLGPAGAQVSAFAGNVSSAESALTSLGIASGTTVAGIAAVGTAAVGTGAFIASSVKDYLDYERSLTRLNSLLKDNAEFEQRRRQILEESNRTGVPKEEVGQKEDVLQRAFKDSEKVARFRPALEELQRTSGESIIALAGPFAALVQGFDIAAEEVRGANARIFADANRSGASVEQYLSVLAGLAPTARTAGIGLDELSPALAAIADKTNDFTRARSTVEKFLNVIVDDTDPARKKLDALGGVDFGRATDKTRDFVAILRQMREATNGAQPEKVAGIFETRYTTAAIAALDEGITAIIDAERNAGAATDAFNKKLADQGALASTQVDRLTNRLSNLKTIVGSSFDIEKGLGGVLEAIAFKKADTVGLSELKGFVDDLIQGAPQAAAQLGKLPPEVQKLFDTADKLREVNRAIASFRSTPNLVQPPTEDAQQLLATREAFLKSLSTSKPTPLTFEAALALEPDSVQKALARINDELKRPLSQIDFSDASFFGDALRDLDRETQKNIAETKRLEAVRDRERVTTDAARKALDDYITSLRREGDEAKLTERQREALQAQRRGEELARAASLGNYEEIGRIVADLTSRNRDLAQVEKNRLDEDIKKAREYAEALEALERYGPFIPEPEPFQPPATPAAEEFGPFQTDDQLRANQRLGELSRSVQQERSLLGLSNEERERAIYLREVEANAIAAGVTNVDALVAAYDAEFRAYQNARRLDELGGNLGRGLADGFEDALFNAKTLDEAINDIGRSLSRIAYNALVTQPLTDFLSGAFRGGLGALFGGGAGGGGGGPIFGDGGAFDRGRVIAYARGGAFSGGRELERFAYGDVFDSPTYFGMAGGRRGVLGEAGPEAIVPLAKMPNGKLGVQSAGEPAPAPTVVQHTTHVTMHVHAKDANSFRSSERQIVSDLKRKTRGR